MYFIIILISNYKILILYINKIKDDILNVIIITLMIELKT